MIALDAASFQSLAGFFLACNNAIIEDLREGRLCFNPWRVFSWLATFISPTLAIWGSAFQSLAGFFLACNRSERLEKGDGHIVSIPGGFFPGLQHNDMANMINTETVSIPGGFFPGLQPKEKIYFLLYLYCFNPWRVFSWLATSDLEDYRGRRREVSIPGGFFPGLQQTQRGAEEDIRRRSFNPWRVFSWLATGRGGTGPGWRT